MSDEIRQLQQAVVAAEDGLYADRNRLRALQSRLAQTRRAADAGAAAQLVQAIAALEQAIGGRREALTDARERLTTRSGELVLPRTPQQLAAELDDDLPILMLPVRIEARFMRVNGGRELWVRVFPDEIAVETHEKTLTRDEAAAGIAYWTAIHRLGGLPVGDERTGREKAAWRLVADPYGGTRAGWIRREIERAIREQHPDFDLSFLETVSGTDEVLRHLGFDPDALAPESWSRAPRSTVMPDRFVLVGQSGDQQFELPFPAVVPYPLIVGPNPQEMESELARDQGSLIVGEDFAWIFDFDKAIAMGLGVRAPLPEPFASGGFDRVMVLGLRLTTSAAENGQAVKALVDSHHYSPDGMSFLAQGTPTNNTAAHRSGFTQSDPGAERSFSVETGAANFTATAEDLEKSDAQRFAEALGIEPTPLAFLEHAGNHDVAEAKAMNRALWPATLGYYLEELLELEDAAILDVRRFFLEHVQARGPLPALRVGKQPYGVLVTSAFNSWQPDSRVDGALTAFLSELHPILLRIEGHWQTLSQQVRHVDASGDAFDNLLDLLGLQATSASFARRRAYGKSYLWNYAHFTAGRSFNVANSGASITPVERYFQRLDAKVKQLRTDLGFHFPEPPRIFELLFSTQQTTITDPLVDDVERAEDEDWSERDELPRKYTMPASDSATTPPPLEERNYIGWLVTRDFATLKSEAFRNAQDEVLPVPRALLYRLLHRALVLANYDATMKLYEANGLARSVRRESDFVNVEAGRTVTRWEFMEAGVARVLPQVSHADLTVAGFLNTPDGLRLPAALPLADVKAAMATLEHLPTARLERLFAEHIDLCAYRLDAWQTGMFANRLAGMRRLRPVAEPGVHLGAYGWLENLRPAPDPEAVEAAAIPESLREDGITVVSQAGNAGHIHAPSINHAVAAAVLRNAYLTHQDEARPEQFSVNLTSERVRIALQFVEGVRNGQELGALLGYQFERGLHDRYLVAGVALEQFILNFRNQYPLVADKITPGPDDAPVQTRETYNVLDGYALVEAAFLNETPLGYPYGVDGLPDAASAAGTAIRTEVERLAASLDAIADLALAEGVYQVVQGNYDRAGAVLKALSEGAPLPEPQVANTPRSGVAVHHKVVVHFETGAATSPWGAPTPRAVAEPGLNRWLAEVLGLPSAIRVAVSDTVDGDRRIIPLADLDIQPIDLVLLTGDQAGMGDLTELERRIDHRYRQLRRGADPGWDASHPVSIAFVDRAGFAADDRTVFELLPLLKTLRRLVTTSRPLAASDFVLPSEQTRLTDPTANPGAWDAEELRQRLGVTLNTFDGALDDLQDSISSFPDDVLNTPPEAVPDLDVIDFELLRQRLIRLSNFGLPDAFPVQPVFPLAGPDSSSAVERQRRQQQLIRQALLVAAGGRGRHAQAVALANLQHVAPDAAAGLSIAAKIEAYRAAARLVLGDAFNLLPLFTATKPQEWRTACEFGRLRQLTRHHAANPQLVEEWVQGVAAVRDNVAALERIRGFHEALNDRELPLVPVQLPHATAAHWVAVAYPHVPPEDLNAPGVFVPSGDYLSIAMQVPAGYDPNGVQVGLVVDEWSELIPNRMETTGIAVHYNQPNTEPPQSLLLAISPTLTGKWSWTDLVAVITDTFDRARRRGVEPDHLAATAYAQLLPAVITSVTSGSKFGTISTSLISAELADS
ncbi:MAG TPA: hypothetical protein VFO21_24455 [Vicinamibacterales bacterium]|nr:hypothetical protein [Vicinamibacterales bacterium]